MSKITRTEYLNNIRNIINEGMSDAPDYIGSDRFSISKHIAGLLEEGHRDPKLMDYLMNWNNALKTLEPNTEYRSYRQFAEGLMVYQSGNAAVKHAIKDINECLSAHGNELDVYCTIDQLSDIAAREAVRESYNEYLFEPTEAHRKVMIDAIWPSFEMNEAAAIRLMTLLTDESLANNELNGYLVELNSYYEDINRQIAKQREEKKAKRIQEKLEAYAEELFENAKAQKQKEKEMYSLAGLANKNNIGLSEAIKSITCSDAKQNKKLMETVEQYAGALNTGLYEERLYETFIRNMQAYTYMLPVEKAIKKVNENVKKNIVSIEITKLLEEMSESSSWQLLPLIEEDCARYAKNPTPNNRVQLRNCLIQFAHDPYCYKILEMVNRDNSKEANTLTERALNFKDNVKLIREHAETSAIYSPVQYIKEGECVFNANGTYFIKKNNTISKLTGDMVNQLSEKFVTLCKLTNDPYVTINEDHIILAINDKVAEIHEGYVDINGCRETQSTLRNLQEMCMKYDFDTNFFIMTSCLLENFNNIAKINFGTHIALKENEGINVDMFRLGENIFIHTVNEDTQTATFFHNVNPLQCKNIINGHMGINVSAMFENLLPAQDKIIMILNETQNAYQDSINKLEATIDKLEAGKKKCNDETAINKLEDGIKTAKEKLKEIKDEYKKWQKEVEEKTGEDMGADEDEPETDEVDTDTTDDEVNGDGDTREETTEEPLDDDEVDDNVDELSTPINGETNANANKEGEEFNLTDDEFDSYLQDGDTAVEPEAEADEPASGEIMPADDVDFNDADTEDGEDTAAEDIANDEATEEIGDEEMPDEEIMSDEHQDAILPDADEMSDDMISGGDEGFDEVSAEDDEINIETPAEEVPSDEDVIVNGDDEVEATDLLGGDTTDPLDDNKVVSDDILPEPTVPEATQQTGETSIITKVLFDENIKTGEKYRSGTISVITPMISKAGELYNKSDDYKFYLNDDGTPVIDAEDMSVTLYNAILDKIKTEPNYDVFVKEGSDRINPDYEKVKDTEAELNAPKETELGVTKVHIPADDEDLLPEPEADDSFFKVTDLPDEFSIEPDFDDATDDEPADNVTVLPVDDTVEDDSLLPDENEEPSVPFIPTYKSGDTEIELPAPDVDDTVIPESKETVKGKKSVNEKRAAIKSFGVSVKSKKGTHFFVNEDTVKSSNRMNRNHSTLVREKIDGAADCTKGSLIEYYNPELDTNNLNKLHYYAVSLSRKASALTGDLIHVSDINSYLMDEEEIISTYNPYFFTIKLANSTTPEEQSYTVYSVEDDVYFRLSYEFDGIIQDLMDEVPGQTIEALRYGYTDNEELTTVDTTQESSIEYAVRAIIQSLIGTTIKDNDISERCKIRKVKLSSNRDFENSKLADDIQHGDKEERDFKANVEKDTRAAGVENPLAPSAPPAEEAYEPVLPNAHRQMSISEMLENYNIIYEANDHVIYNKCKAEVVNISEDGLSADILLTDGETIKVATKDLEPDPEYINDLNVETHDKELIKNDVPDGHDIDEPDIKCNIVVDGYRINVTECYASLQDIKDSKKMIHVMNEDGIIDEYDINNNINFEDLPYAVVVNAEGEPIRKIRIYPQSYVNAGPDDLVKCICGDKETSFPKRAINILS